MNNHEEVIYNNVLSYRNDPEDKPTMYTRQELTEIILREREERAEAEQFLQCLQAAGVDNWEGFDEAVEMMEDK